MEVLRFALALLTLLVITPVVVYCLEVIAGCWSRRRSSKPGAGSAGPRFAVIVPAHNEEAGIAATLASIQPQLAPGDRLLVVADNCSDGTARVAREHGATALERRDEYRRGKGFALDFALKHLHREPPDVVLFFDADCRLGPQTVDVLAREAAARQRPVQALYLCEPTSHGGPQQAISSFAFRFKNLVRTAGISNLGGGCYLTGSGMALPWALVDKVPWATGNVVEDMQLGIDFTLAGYPPVFAPAAQVFSNLPESNAALQTQRRRWEHGFLATACSQVPLLLSQAWERRSWALLVLAFDLTVPPLALLSLALISAALVTLMIYLVGLGAWPLAIVTTAACAFASTTFLGWYIHCRDEVPLKFWLQVPRYALAKIPLYLEFLTRREQQWIRTERTPARR